MPKVEVDDVTAFMRLQPLHRNLIFFNLSILLLLPIAYLIRVTVYSFRDLQNITLRTAIVTQSTIAVLFVFICIMTPTVALYNLHRARIRKSSSSPSFLSLFRLRNPFDARYRASAKKIARVLAGSLRHETGDAVSWSGIEQLDTNDEEYIRIVVEEGIIVHKSNETGEVYFIERCAWLLIFAYLALLNGILIAGTFSLTEIKQTGVSTDGAIGKTLSEWMSNYVLLIIGFLQIVTRGAWFKAFSGLCAGAASTMTIGHRNSLVALYVVLADEQVEGLRAEGSYARFKMCHSDWTAPPVSTAVIAAVRKGRLFIVRQDEDQWSVKWLEESDEESKMKLEAAPLDVRYVGKSFSDS